MIKVVFLLEEKSAKEMLDIIISKLAENMKVTHEYIVFEGKSDLDKHVAKRIKAYRIPNTVFIILRDQDQGSCKEIKQNLVDKVPDEEQKNVRVIIACRELESFYLGDLAAVEKGLGIEGLANKQNSAKCRNPDGKVLNAKEYLRKITNKKYNPIGGSRAIAAHLDLSGTNKSRSFNFLLNTIKSLMQ